MQFSNQKNISVITINFNDLIGLQRTINSVCEQDYKAFEYIVVDGGSSDGSSDLIKQTSLVSKYVSETDDGIYDAMNKGIELSSGDYLIFLNSGDTFAGADVLMRLALDLVSAEDVIFGDHVVTGALRRNGLRKAATPKDYRKGMFACHQSMLFKRSCFSSRYFSEDYGSAGDYEFLVYLVETSRSFKKLEYPISTFMGGGISDSSRVASLRNSIRALKTHRLYDLRARITFFTLMIRAHIFECFFTSRLKKSDGIDVKK